MTISNAFASRYAADHQDDIAAAMLAQARTEGHQGTSYPRPATPAAESKVSPIGGLVLAYLREAGPQTVGAIATHLGRLSGSTHNALGVLLAEGRVTRGRQGRYVVWDVVPSARDVIK